MIKRISILLLCLSCVAKADNVTKYYRLLAARSTGPELWTPADQTNVTAWYNGANTDGLTVSNQFVIQWHDSGPKGNHVTDAGLSARRPIWTNTFNGLNVMRFDGTDDRLVSQSYTQAQPYAVFAVAKFADQQFQALFDGATSQSAGFRGSAATFLATAGVNYQYAVFATNSLIHSIVFQGATSYGGTNGTMTAAGNAGTNAMMGISIADTRGSPNPIAAYPLNGFIAEIVVVGFSPSTNERQRVEGYLAHKWGLQGNLPADHPYKTSAPTK